MGGFILTKDAMKFKIPIKIPGKNPMFESFQIILSEPICSCENQNLEWGITYDRRLVITCITCCTKLEVPYSTLTALFFLKKPYPGKRETIGVESEKNKIETIEKAEKE